MAKKFKDLANACWKGYKAVGLKDKNGKKVPNCVPEETQIQEADEIESSDYKLSASGKKVRAKHIIFHSQDDDKKEDDKENMKEETLVEATVETKKYSWGTMKTVHHGADFSIPLHPEHHRAIAKLHDTQEHHFKDETGHHWTARRVGNDVHFQGANGGGRTKVKHADLKEEKLSDDEMAERERIVKGMKKNLQSFKDKYGERAKEVMYATATKLAKEEVQLDEANHREFASQGKMHPDMAKHMTVGSHMDYYEPKTGDKVHGKVIKNDGKEVHVKQSHDSYDSKKVGSMHKFKVSSTLEEGRMKDIATNAQETDRLKKKNDVPFDGPYTKTPSNTTDKSGATHTPMSRARDLARQAMKKQMKEEFGVDIDDETADGLVEVAQKVDIPAYLRKQKGEAPLTLKDLKRKDTISDKENLAKLRNEALKGNQHKLDKNKNGKLDADDFEKLRKEQFENGEVETCMKSYKDFVQSLNEYKSQDGVYRHQGTYGGSHQEPEDDDEDDKPKAKPQGEKRGRGRPKGAASGARQKGTAAKRKTDGADYTGYKLHLPNTNK